MTNLLKQSKWIILPLPLIAWLIMLQTGIILWLRCNPDSEQLNILPLVLLLTASVLAYFLRARRWIVIICAIMAVLLLLISFDEKLNPNIDLRSMNTLQAYPQRVKTILEKQLKSIEQYRRFHDERLQLSSRMTVEDFIRLNNELDQWVVKSNDPIISLLALSIKILSAFDLVKAAGEDGVPDQNIMTALQESEQAITKHYYHLNFDQIYVDYPVQLMTTLGVMTNRRANSIYDLLIMIDNNPSVLGQKEDVNEQLKWNVALSNGSVATAQIIFLKKIYKCHQRYKIFIESYKNGRVKEFFKDIEAGKYKD